MSSSLEIVETARILGRRADGAPIVAYRPLPGVPPVTVFRLDRDALAGLQDGHAHAHDFPVLAYFERGGGVLTVAGRERPVEAGDLYIVAPGELVGTNTASSLRDIEGWSVFFAPEILGLEAPGAFLTWRSHPLLYPFVQGTAGGAHHVQVPVAEREAWSRRMALLYDELRERRDGYREAVLAHLTLLLVDIGRMAVDVVGDLQWHDEPLLAAVFRLIDERFSERISLKDVAWSVSLSPGYLTTLVRRKTGRTVQQWITERRLTEARRLLVETDLSVQEVGAAVGYGDAGYFVRSFRRAHGVTPHGWRRASRA